MPERCSALLSESVTSCHSRRAAYLDGEYGVNGLFVGVPCKLGAAGIEKIYELKLTADETAALHKSAASVKELVDVIKSKM